MAAKKFYDGIDLEFEPMRTVADAATHSTSSRLAVCGPAAGKAVGLIQPSDIEHRRTTGHPVKQDITAGVGGSANRVFRGTGAGQRERAGQVDGHLEHVCLRVEYRGQAGDEVLGREKPPVLIQMQPESPADQFAYLLELDAFCIVRSRDGRPQRIRKAP